MTDGADSRDQAALVRALLEARERGDAALTERAARQLPRGQRFGTHPGQLPALLHAEYQKATDLTGRCGLAAALARAWVYGGHPERACAFAEEALRLSAQVADPAAAVDALDAMLLARWGPDALGDRLRLAARIEEAAAYLGDPEPRLSAYLWRLTTAWECLDVVGVQRQLRALDTLAEDSGSPRIAFFAASRRAMHALVTADLAAADELIARTRSAGDSSGEPDLEAVTHSLDAARARGPATWRRCGPRPPRSPLTGPRREFPRSPLRRPCSGWKAASRTAPANCSSSWPGAAWPGCPATWTSC